IKALDSFASAQSETTEFGRRMSADVDQIHAVFDAPADRGSLKATIESRLKAMRGALDDFLDHQRELREAHVTRSQTLSARMQQLETETNELRTRLEESHAEARVDTLTGVPNRLALEDQLFKEYERACRHGHALSYAVLDLDHFKRINDTHGHAAGDKVLQQVATLCSKNLRTNDFFARYGGEEFVMLLTDTDAAGAVSVANKLREVIGRVRFHRSGEPVEVTLSIGVAQLRQGDSLETLFERADKALYEAKRTGRDRVVSAPA
ncbi:MAG: diguanylate cyclase, partial [Gammaproteobacteria bacterium]|nr:diguanylate cyclase [Gammaproteobacteria bacterium]